MHVSSKIAEWLGEKRSRRVAVVAWNMKLFLEYVSPALLGSKAVRWSSCLWKRINQVEGRIGLIVVHFAA